jgi:hypothetical protein
MVLNVSGMTFVEQFVGAIVHLFPERGQVTRLQTFALTACVAGLTLRTTSEAERFAARRERVPGFSTSLSFNRKSR